MMAAGRSYEGSTGRRVVAVQDHSVSQSSRRATADQDDLKFGFGNQSRLRPYNLYRQSWGSRNCGPALRRGLPSLEAVRLSWNSFPLVRVNSGPR